MFFFTLITQDQKYSILKLVWLKRLKVYPKLKNLTKKFFEKKKIQKKIFFCENEKLNYTRFLGVFYYHWTMNVPCISEKMSIRNWVTFLSSRPFPLNLQKINAISIFFWKRLNKIISHIISVDQYYTIGQE